MHDSSMVRRLFRVSAGYIHLGRRLWQYRRALRHPQTPTLTKALLWTAALYAVSPVDVLPDFIPLAGYFDDMAIVSLLVAAAIRIIPSEVLQESRITAR